MSWVLYQKQRRILTWLAQYIQKNGYAPTLREMARGLQLSSVATVHEHLSNLRDRGLIEWDRKSRRRSIRILDHNVASRTVAPGPIELPIMGYIAAGMPIQTFNDPNAVIAVPTSMVPEKRRSYVLQVRGDSMVDVGILDHDYVVVEETEEVSNGTVAVALLENGMATLKRIYKEATRVRLEPANSTMSPIFANRVRIQGRVIGVIRRYADGLSG